MKNKFVLKTFFIATLFGSAAMLSFYTPHVSASTSRLYLSPSSGKYKSGQSFTVKIRVSAGQSVNAVQANLSYSATKLSVSSMSYGGSAFEIQAESSASGGSIRIGRGTTSAFTGDRLVGSITFKAKTGSGSASVSFTGGTTLANNGSSITSSTSGGSYSFYTPTSTSSSSSSKNSSSTSSKTTTTAPASTADSPKPDTKKKAADKTGPTIADITMKSNGPGTSVISFSTNEKAKTTVEYGLGSSYGITQSSRSQTTGHSFTLNAKYLLPKTTYHYRIVATDTHGNKTISGDRSFTTSGAPFTMTVQDKNGQPLQNATVTIDGEEKRTDKNGKAEFSLSLGRKTATVQYGGTTTLQSFLMDSRALNGTLVNSKVRLNTTPTSKLLPALVIVVMLAGATGLGYYLRTRWLYRLSSFLRHRPSQPVMASATTSAAAVAATPLLSDSIPAVQETPVVAGISDAPEESLVPSASASTTAATKQDAEAITTPSSAEVANTPLEASPLTAYSGEHTPGETIKPS